MFFDDWGDVGRVLALGLLAYVGVVIVLRVSGKRTLAKLNAFDLVVTVALGSTLATILLSQSVSLAEGAAAVVVLVVGQYVITKASIRWRIARKVAKSEPALLVDDGRVCVEMLERNRVTVGEVHQAIRATGCGDVARIAAVVLETDGSLSVISRDSLGSGSALADVAQPAANDGRADA
jgi:uncharacterized membrane protein YcaP (DUF421 family)